MPHSSGETPERQTLRALAETAVAVTRASSLQETLDVITGHARRIIGAHQAATSLTTGADLRQQINAVSLSSKYEAWQSYSVPPGGSGIYAAVCRENRPVRMTQADLEAHPAWRGFGTEAGAHPPMRGWLAAPLVGHEGRNLGLIQLSDKNGGEFTDADLDILVQLATLAGAAIERVQAEEELRLKSGLLDAVIRQAPMGISIAAAPDGRPVVMNDKLMDILGHGPDGDDLTRYARYGAIHPDGRPYAVGDYPTVRALAQGEAINQEDMIYRRAGPTVDLRYLSVSSAPVRGEDGGIVAAATVFLDVTELRRTEEALRRQVEVTRGITDNAPDALFLTDLDGRIAFANPAAEILFGYADGELVGKHLHDALHFRHPDGRAFPAADCPLAQAVRHGRTLRDHEDLFFRKDGLPVPVACSIGQVRASKGHDAGAVYTVRDITAEKEAEDRQMLLAREVDHRAKNVLAVVQAVLRLTRTEKPADYIEAVEGRIAALARAHGLLATGRWGGADLRAVAAEELASYGSRIRMQGPPATLAADTVQPMALVLHELATNAAKYGALSIPTGRITLTWITEPNGGLRLLWQEDGGPPIIRPPSHRGFGSEMIDQVAAQLGDGVAFSWEQAGLRCTIRVSPDNLSAAASISTPSPPVAATPEAERLDGRRVLVVEDDALLALAMQRMLEDLGCDVPNLARTLPDALQLAAGLPDLDAAVLDVDLRGEAVWPVVDQLRERAIPYLLTTGYGQGLDTRGAPVLEKPFNPARLSAALRILFAQGTG